MSLQDEAARAAREVEERRIEALFTWITNDGKAYGNFRRAVIGHYLPSWWVSVAESVAIRDHDRLLSSAGGDGDEEPPFTVSEVLQGAVMIERYFHAHFTALAS